MNQLGLFNNAESWEIPTLATQLDRIFNYMRSGQWRSLPEISEATNVSEAGASAQLRHLRKDKFKERYPVVGGHDSVKKRRRKDAGRLWEYQVVTN